MKHCKDTSAKCFALIAIHAMGNYFLPSVENVSSRIGCETCSAGIWKPARKFAWCFTWCFLFFFLSCSRCDGSKGYSWNKMTQMGDEISRAPLSFLIVNQRMPGTFHEMGLPSGFFLPNGPWNFTSFQSKEWSYLVAGDYATCGWEIYRNFSGTWEKGSNELGLEGRREAEELKGRVLTYYLAAGEYPASIDLVGLDPNWGLLGPWSIEIKSQSVIRDNVSVLFKSRESIVFIFRDSGWYIDR